MAKRDSLVILGAVALLFLMKKKGGAPGSESSVPASSSDFASAWDSRAKSLIARARGGSRWAAMMAKRLGSPDAGAAASRWIGIESGGNPRASSSLNERGLAQVSKQSLQELGLTDADFEAMNAPGTTDDVHADMAAAVIGGEVVSVAAGGDTKALAPAWGPALGPVIELGKGRKLSLGPKPAALGIGIAKMRHGLPLLVKELRNQGHIRTTIPLTIRSALSGAIGAGTPTKRFTPSARLASFAGGSHKVTGDPAADLLLRFLVPVAVVAHGEGAIGMGSSGKDSGNA